MLKRLAMLTCYILLGIVSSISIEAAVSNIHGGASRNITPDFSYVCMPRTYYENTGNSRMALSLSMAQSAASHHYAYQNYANQEMRFSPTYLQQQLQASQQAYAKAPTELRACTSAFCYQVESQSLSLTQLKAENLKLQQEIAVWQNKLSPLLNLRRDLEATSAFSYVPQEGFNGGGYHDKEVPLRLAPEVCLCLQNEAAIKQVAAEISYREQCVLSNQQRIQELSAQLQATKVDALVGAPEKAYTTVAQEIPKTQASLEQTAKSIETKQTELRAVRRDFSHALIKISELDHCYHPFSGSEIATLREQNGKLKIQMSALEETLGKLNHSQELDKNELVRLEQVVANGRHSVDECARLQKYYLPVDQQTGIPVDKQRCAALAETVNSKNAQSVIVIELSKEAHAFLKDCGIDIAKITEKFNGNAFQKQLSSEIGEILNRSSKTFFASKDVTIRSYAQATAHTCVVAQREICTGTPRQALTWANVAHLCERATEIAKGAALGAIKGVVDTYTGITHAICHPVEFVDQCRSLLRFCCNLDGISIDKTGRVSVTDTRLDVIMAMYNEFDQLPAEKQMEHVTSMIVSFVLPMPSAKMVAQFGKPFAYLHKAIKTEAAALRSSSNMGKVPSVGAALVEGVHLAMRPLVGSRAKTAESVTNTLSESLQGTRALSSTGVSASHLESASAHASNALESETKLAASTTATQPMAQTATQAVASVTSSAAESISSTVQASKLAVESEAKVTAATAAAATMASSSQTATRIFKERKVTPEEAIRMTRPKKVERIVLSETEAKALVAEQQVAPKSIEELAEKIAGADRSAEQMMRGKKVFKIVDDRGKVQEFPIRCPTSKELYHHVFRIWENVKGFLTGGHMPKKYPECVSRLISGPNEQGLRELILGRGGKFSKLKTVGPDSWNLVDYANHLKEAYGHIQAPPAFVREGVFRLRGLDKSGITWEMYIELKQEGYKLTTGYPIICPKT